jgi:murein DD-endopeptidase MepM/ murein hydrolase activator NlpD
MGYNAVMARGSLSKAAVFLGLLVTLAVMTACSEQIEFDTRLSRHSPARPATSSLQSKLPPSGNGPRVVTVQKGDTVFAISRRYDVEVRNIIDANGLEPPYALKPGDRLKLTYPPLHVVEKGETGYSISRRYGVDLTTLMRLNHIDAPYGVFVGQKLELPAGKKELSAPKPPLPPPPRSGKGFAWPLRGPVLSDFGEKEGGLHNDGVNIGAKEGAPVRAAESGVVAYAGNGLKGYGNLLLLRHDGGWVTAYAHNQQLLVKRGEKVARGQQIALAGLSGNVPAAQLHFEIRQGTVAVNPLTLLQ